MQVELMQHQRDAVRFALKNKGIAALHWEPGCGKTLGALTIFKEFRINEPDLKLLVICPISLIHGAWSKEIEKFTDFSWIDWHGDACGGVNMPNGGIKKTESFDILLINFEFLISIKKFEACKNFMKDGNWMVVIDESSKMKNHAGVITSRLIGDWDKKRFVPGIKQFCKYRIELTGTPAPNIEWEYWAQMKFLSDAILGDNFYKFRNKYFFLQRGREIVPGAVYNKAALREMFNNGYKYEFDERERERFFEALRPWCHVVKQKDCMDLPEMIDEYRMFDMEGEQARVYKEMKTEYIAEIKQIINAEKEDPRPLAILDIMDGGEGNSTFAVANIILTKLLKLRQITCGFAIDEYNKAIPIIKESPKVKILLELVEEIGNDQMIIWCQFKYEIQLVTSRLKEIAGVSELHGGIPDKERIDHLNNFISGKNRFLVAHVRSAAHGLTLVNCRYETFFSMDASYESYEQARKRIHRHGQILKCVYFHILARNSVDEDMLAICQKKSSRQDIAERFMKNGI